jgi:hypothetical protein
LIVADPIYDEPENSAKTVDETRQAASSKRHVLLKDWREKSDKALNSANDRMRNPPGFLVRNIPGYSLITFIDKASGGEDLTVMDWFDAGADIVTIVSLGSSLTVTKPATSTASSAASKLVRPSAQRFSAQALKRTTNSVAKSLGKAPKSRSLLNMRVGEGLTKARQVVGKGKVVDVSNLSKGMSVQSKVGLKSAKSIAGRGVELLMSTGGRLFTHYANKTLKDWGRDAIQPLATLAVRSILEREFEPKKVHELWKDNTHAWWTNRLLQQTP